MNPVTVLPLISALFLAGGPARAAETGGHEEEGRKTAPAPEPGRLELAIDTDRTVGTCHRFWTVSVFTSQDRFASTSCGEKLKRKKPFMKEANCVRLLGGRTDNENKWYKGVDERGNVKTDFTGLVSYMRGLVSNGYKPRLVLDNVPTAMSTIKEMNYYGNTNPPDDYDVWRQFITALLETLVREFGFARVKTWRFRVGTEPDLRPAHWNGTKEQYLKHYDITVDAVTRIIPEADIGPGNVLNPGAEGRWGLDIIDHAAAGTNYATGKTGTLMRHFSISFYGNVGQPIGLEKSIHRVRERLDRYPAIRDIPVDLAEFGVLRDEHRRRLRGNEITEWGASWYAAVSDIIYRNGVAEAYEWNQETEGLVHPRLQVTRMLEMMAKGRRLDVEVTGKATGRAGAIACIKENKVYLLLYNHHPKREPKVRNTLSLMLRGEHVGKARLWRMNEWSIDRDHGVWAYELYRDIAAAGIEPRPNSPVYGGKPSRSFDKGWKDVFDRNRAKYERIGALHQTARNRPVSVREGVIAVEFDMPGHSVKLIELRAGSVAAITLWTRRGCSPSPASGLLCPHNTFLGSQMLVHTPVRSGQNRSHPGHSFTPSSPPRDWNAGAELAGESGRAGIGGGCGCVACRNRPGRA